MFEIGKYYRLAYGTKGNWESISGYCVDWQHPLLKFREDNGHETIINTANSGFYQAEVSVPLGEQAFGSFGSLTDHLKEA